jgi:hypothetical protein
MERKNLYVQYMNIESTEKNKITLGTQAFSKMF